MPPELSNFWGAFEVDIFNWYRMIIVGAMAAVAVPLLRRAPWQIAIYLLLLLVSFILSPAKTSFLGTPNHHEGLLALMGYVGVFLMAIRTGLTKQLEKSLSLVVLLSFFGCALQWRYGNFLDWPPLKYLMPDMPYTAVRWPLYGLQGNPNHLGLLCSLFLPYCIVKRKWLQTACLTAMLIGSGNRAALVCAAIPLIFHCRGMRWFLYLMTIAFFVMGPRAKECLQDIHWPLSGHDLGGRAHLWKMELPLIRHDILIGDGPGTYPTLIKQDNFFGQNVIADRPHNLYLNIWQTSGLLSLSILAWIVIEIMNKSRDTALRLGAIAYLINSLFTDSVLCVTPYFLIFLGVMAYGNNEKERHRSGTAASKPSLG